VLTILDESLVDFREQGFFCEALHADIVVFGEALADRQVPFGAFLMSDRVFRPWSTNSSFRHGSTFGGGETVLSVVLDTLRTHWAPAADEQAVLASIASSRRTRRRLHRTHVQDGRQNRLGRLARRARLRLPLFGMSLTGMDFDLVEASGSRLRTSNGVELLDGVGCAGASLRGHNPPDLVDVLRRHDPTRDYWSELREQLHELTGLPCAFPGVSGASVVEHALILGELAAGERRRIVTFEGNYAGVTPVALNCSAAHGPNEPYGPCRDVVFFDPFSPDTPEALRRELASGQVGLVWLELIRGVDIRQLPDDIFRVINEERRAGGYLVGVDEVLTGTYRTGPFLCSQGRLADPDIVTLAKGLSDMFIPFGVTLVTSEVEAAARDRNPELVDALERRLLNQLGSHVALNALRYAADHDMENHVRRVGQRLREGLTEALRSVDYLVEARAEVRGEGLLLCVDWPDSSAYAHSRFGSTLSERGAVVFNRVQCKPALTITEAEVDVFVRQVADALRGTTRLGDRARGLARILSAAVLDRGLRSSAGTRLQQRRR
jgi:acetylornithine/succinyldiaminopimelate/putrescine aminotransferase